MKKKGFTVIELLIVVAIIGIIGSFIAIKTVQARKRGEFAQVVTQFQQIERAFLLAYFDEERTTWWTEAEIGLGGNPTLTEIIAIDSGPLATFSDYFPTSPINVLSNTLYEYDHDNDTAESCTNGDNHKGVNLLITGVENQMRRDLDKYIDGEYSPFCGKITYNPNDFGQKPERMFYHIVNSGNEL